MPSVAVLGTGQVGQAIARRAAEVGWQTFVGARTATSESLAAFADDPVRTGSFADAAGSAELIVNATNGAASLEALASIGAEGLSGKVIVDVSNELIPSESGFPVPAAGPDNSLGQRLQRAFPAARVVKALNTMNNSIMVRPDLIAGDHLVFLSGDDTAAKARVGELLSAFGWRTAQIFDLGGIDTAAATEMMMLAWMRITQARGMDAPRFNWAILAAED